MTFVLAHHEQHHLAARWAAGFGVIRHRDNTQVQVFNRVMREST